MNPSPETYHKKVWVIILMILSLIGLAISAYLSYTALTGGEAAGCTAGSSCGDVLGTRWATVFGLLPVSVLSTSIYAATLCALLFLVFSADRELEQLILRMLLVVSGAVAGSALWFVVLQALVVRAYCTYCMSAHAVGVMLSVLVWTGSRPEGSTGSKRLLLVLAGGGMAVLLALAQVCLHPASTYVRGYTEQQLPVPDRAFTPVIGRPDAPHACHLLFDYQCSHCRLMHRLAEELTASTDSVCFLLCPTPLSPACNPYIPGGGRDLFAGSCELAQMAEALWLTDEAAFRAFDAYLFEPGPDDVWHPRKGTDARAMAEKLVGRDVLDAALRREEIRRSFAAFTQLFGRTTLSEKSGIPRVVYGGSWVIPEVENVAQLKQLLLDVFGIATE